MELIFECPVCGKEGKALWDEKTPIAVEELLCSEHTKKLPDIMTFLDCLGV
ncbi:hypothetical protein LCGC14_0800620 [marine sediment metagenome]|uniref:Uncharacterized protein n=1 Tax=marine sediment metagenome TaxID=412755 RepID=A0A0F9SWU3_9ZZZZ